MAVFFFSVLWSCCCHFDTFPVSEYFNFPLTISMCYSTRFYTVVGTTKYHKLGGRTNRHTDDKYVFVPITRQGTIRKQTSIDMLNVNYFVDNWVFVFEHKLPRMQSIRSETCNLVKYTSSIDYPPTLYWCSHTEFWSVILNVHMTQKHVLNLRQSWCDVYGNI